MPREMHHYLTQYLVTMVIMNIFIETLIKNGALVDLVNNYGVSPKSLAGTIANYDTHKFFSEIDLE